MIHECKKGVGTPPNYQDRCFLYYNGECMRDNGERCYYNLGKKKKEDKK